MPERHSPETIRRALEYVSPDCDRDTWVRVLAAIKSELGDDGRELAQTWSAGADSFKAADFSATWRSLRAAGGVTIGTLLAMAKDGGYRPDAKTPAASAADDAARAAERKAHAERDEQLRRRKRAEAAEEARRRWQAASDTGHSPYLERKGVLAHGVRFEPDGTLLVPMFDAAGALCNLQAIAPDGSKRFLPGGQALEAFFCFSASLEGGAAALAEGYATAATIHEATGLAVWCAFTAGNLQHVAHYMRKQHPQLRIVVCADDDHETAARSSKNPGLQAARAAARVGRAVVVKPEGLGEGESDFNDMARRAGLPAVAAIVRAALAADANGADEADEDDGEPFKLTARGIFHRGRDRDGHARAEWVCGPLELEAHTRDGDGASWGYLLRFHDRERNEKRIAIPARLFAGDGVEVRARLADEGFVIATGPAKNRLGHYIATRKPERFVRCVEAAGWHDGAFVLPDRSYGPGAGDLFYQTDTDARVRSPFKRAGTLAGWREHVAARCVGNPRLAFVVSLAFAGPALHLVELLGGGFHFYGASSKGKTTLLRAGASVYGKPELGAFIRSWRATSNALESTAATFSDAVLFLDEIRECAPGEIVPSVMMLGNGQGKGRSRAGGGMRVTHTWRLLFASSGERAMADLAGIAGLPVDPGAGVRLVELPVPPSGAFDQLHGAADGATFAEQLREAALRDYGAAGDAWLQHLTADVDAARAFLREAMADLLEDILLRRTDAGQVQRVAARFALVGAAGALATRAGITGWPLGEAERAAKALFADWLHARGTRGDAEELAALRQVAGLLSQHAESYFPWWHRGSDDRRPNAPKRWGLRRMVDDHGNEIESASDRNAVYGDGAITERQGEAIAARFYVLASAFRDELCKGLDARYVAGVLQRRGYLIPENDRRLDRSERLPGVGKARCYVVKPEIFEDPNL